MNLSIVFVLSLCIVIRQINRLFPFRVVNRWIYEPRSICVLITDCAYLHIKTWVNRMQKRRIATGNTRSRHIVRVERKLLSTKYEEQYARENTNRQAPTVMC